MLIRFTVERSSSTYTSQKFRYLRHTLYPFLVSKLGFPKSIVKSVRDELTETFHQEQIRLSNRRIGLVGTSLDHFSEFKGIEVYEKASKAIDWIQFLRELGNIQARPSTRDDKEDSLDETIWGAVLKPSKPLEQTWKSWLKTYRETLKEQPLDPIDRKQYVESFHPAFVPRSHVIGSVLKDIEANDTSSFQELMEHIKTPYNDTNVRFFALLFMVLILASRYPRNGKLQVQCWFTRVQRKIRWMTRTQSNK